MQSNYYNPIEEFLNESRYQLINKVKKTIMYVAVLIGMVFSYGCDRNVNDNTYRFLIENNSGSEINISVFKSISNTFVQEIRLGQGDVMSWEIISSERDATPGIQRYFQGDSVAIVFGNEERIINYECRVSVRSEACDVEGNILNVTDSKWEVDVTGGFTKRTYIFTEEDYEEAAPCDGECQ